MPKSFQNQWALWYTPIVKLLLILSNQYLNFFGMNVQLNEELEKAYKMQKEFINVASHGLRIPIQAILGMSGLLNNAIPKKRTN